MKTHSKTSTKYDNGVVVTRVAVPSRKRVRNNRTRRMEWMPTQLVTFTAALGSKFLGRYRPSRRPGSFNGHTVRSVRAFKAAAERY